MVTKMNGVRLLYLPSLAVIVFLVTNNVSSEATKCELYKGEVCDKKVRKGVDMKYSIPEETTQSRIEEEIESALNETSFKYSACKHYVNYLMCIDKFRSCNKDNLPICRDSCESARKSICFAILKNGSKLEKWFRNEFDCKKLPNTSNCASISERQDVMIKENSCMREIKNKNKEATNLKVLMRLNKQEPVLDKTDLQKRFKDYIGDDLECCTGRMEIKDSLKTKIRPLKNMLLKLNNKVATWYCVSKKTKTKIIPLESSLKYKAPSGIYFDNTQAYIVKTDTDAFVALTGQDHVCLDIGNFHYIIQQDKENIVTYHGQSDREVQYKWIDMAENNPYGSNDAVLDVMKNIKISQKFFMTRPIQTIVWTNENKYRLFEDNSSRLTITFDEHKRLNGSIQYPEETIILKNIKSQIAVVGEGKKSVIFLLRFSSDMDLVKTFRILIGEENFKLYLAHYLEQTKMDNFMLFEEVEYFFKVKQTEDTIIKLPSSKHFSRLSSFISRHGKDELRVKAKGRIGKSIHKPDWLEDVGFTLISKVYWDDDVKVFLFKMDFHQILSYEECANKAMKKNNTRRQLNILLSKLENYKDSWKTGKNITKPKIETTKCICCKHDVYTLKTVTLEVNMYINAHITIDLVRKDKKYSFHFRNLSLLVIDPDEKWTHDDKRNINFLGEK